ncbi:hypothetical protein [Anabaena azotica]|nr:hypothetical protein [Anabaena azotica]
MAQNNYPPGSPVPRARETRLQDWTHLLAITYYRPKQPYYK